MLWQPLCLRCLCLVSYRPLARKKQSVTGAIDAALKKLGVAWPGAASVDSDDEELGPRFAAAGVASARRGRMPA